MHPGFGPPNIEEFFTHAQHLARSAVGKSATRKNVLGGGRLGTLGLQVREKLWELQKLYFLDTEENDSSLEKREAGPAGVKRMLDEGEGPDNEPECSQGPPAKKQRQDKPHDSGFRRATTCPPLMPPDLSNGWDLGPELTAQLTGGLGHTCAP